MNPQYIVWSFDPSEDQVFTDIHRAKSPKAAERLVKKNRPYATLDGTYGPMLLSDYVAKLQEKLK